MPLVGHALGMPRRAPPLEFVPRALGHGRAQGHVLVLRRSTISTRLAITIVSTTLLLIVLRQFFYYRTAVEQYHTTVPTCPGACTVPFLPQKGMPCVPPQNDRASNPTRNVATWIFESFFFMLIYVKVLIFY